MSGKPMRFANEDQYLEYLRQMQEHPTDGIKLKNFSRVQIVNEDGSIAGDSGFVGPNQVVNLGFLQYLVMSLGSISGSKYLTHGALGTGGAPAAADTSLAGEVGTRTALTLSSTVAGSKTLRAVCTFAAGWHTSGAAHTISNIGMYNTSSGGTLFCGNTYEASSCASNQAVRSNWQPLLVTIVQKLRKFGEHLIEAIPSQAPVFALGKV